MSSETENRGESCRRFAPLLDDLVDGRLTESRQGRVRRHLADCGPCAARLRSLEDLLAEASALPRELEPAADLWPEIAPRLTARRQPAPGRWPAWMRQAAAAVLFMALGALLSQTLWPGRSRDVREAPDDAGLDARASFALAEADYLRAKETLWAAVYHGGRVESPETREVVERNLRVIDQAIEELRQALDADPGNRQLESLLLARHRTEIDLLQRLRKATAVI